MPFASANDKMGNSLTLTRNGWQDNGGTITYPDMDILDYDYGAGNKLTKVSDTGNGNYGFKDGTNTNDDFAYDANGNLEIDRNKGITGITYNYLNLPVTISIDNSPDIGTITYTYDATGIKLKKIVTGSSTGTTEYSGNYVYEDTGGGAVLQFFNHPEGYVNANGSGYEYVYQYKDHLGNVRLSYTDDPSNPGTPTIIEENNYYPFGMKHKGYNSGGDTALGNDVAQKWKFGGKELIENLGLNWLDYGWRNFDVAMGRWMNIDNLAGMMKSQSPYNYALNNPVYYIDIDGLMPGNGPNHITDYYDDGRGNIVYDPNVHGPGDVPDGATYIGRYYWNAETQTLWGPGGVPTSTGVIALDGVTVTAKDKSSKAQSTWDGNTTWGFGTEDRGRSGNRRGGIDVEEVSPGGSLKGGGNLIARLLRFLTGTPKRVKTVQDIVGDNPNQSTMELQPIPEPTVVDPYAFILLQFRRGESFIDFDFSHDFFVPRHGVEGAYQNAVNAADSIILHDVDVDSISIQSSVIRGRSQNRISSVKDTVIRRQ
ncbi:RHS repeat domain-containing protein [Ulvibacterium sp.]|uniref:RHS repeat domain-containing protein n=1 Tax=Ulvibacterium sp. TaxID=2665914 RepID=UPI003CC5387B